MITTRSGESAPAAVAQLPVALDTKGRVRVTREQRQVILAELARSGESIPQFAQRTGLKYSTLAAWVARARRVKRSARPAPLRLVEAVVAPAAPATPLVVELLGQARFELQEVRQIPLAVALVRALEKPC
jgi:transposase-like protein